MSPRPTGLSSDEAARRLRDEGANDLPRTPRRTMRRIVADAAREPMFQLLVAGVIVYLLIGDAGEAMLLMGFVAVTIGISVVQQQRTERVLESLHELASPRALVLRDGQPRRIPGREVVRGDLMVLSAGDRVAADAQILSCQALVIDESLLTGESVPVCKRARPESDTPTPGARPSAAEAPPGGEDQPQVWAGTLVAGGQGLVEVTATGPRSALGRIGRTLAQTETPVTPLTVQTRRLVRLCAFAAALVSLGLVAAFTLRGDAFLDSLLAGITLAMSLLPEEFTLILTVFMAMGAWRLSSARVLSRRPAAIEALGAASVLCADKTGTMTLNRMAVAELAAADGDRISRWQASPTPQALGSAERRLLHTALLASPDTTADPMERALHALGPQAFGDDGLPPSGSLVQAWGLDPALLAMTHVWLDRDGKTLTIASKGAPEAVESLCGGDESGVRAWRAEAEDMAARGLRVIGVAGTAAAASGSLPSSPRAHPLQMHGLIGLADPLRPGVAEAVQQCHRAGVRVAMVTGDHATTARAVARQAGLPVDAGVLTGPEIDMLDDGQLADKAAQICVFARVLPAHKLRLVRALQARGEVVAMTGDGVNDAPALKAAHIGIAMGGRGTDVAREAASLVLLDDDFGAIVQGLRLGRRILDNVRKAMGFVLAVHVPIAGLSLLPLLTGGPPLLTPVHIAFLELLIDPVCSIVFEAEGDEPGLMRRPPRAPDAPLMSRDFMTTGLVQGGLAWIAAAAVYFIAGQSPWPPELQRAAVFCTLVLGVLALIVANRSLAAPWWSRANRPRNPALSWAVGLCLALLGGVMGVPAVASLFGFVVIEPTALLLAVTAVLVLLVVLGGLNRGAGRKAAGA